MSASLDNPNDIPKEELMQLCMKMNKRMSAMETKGKELLKKRASLLNERQKLLEIISRSLSFSVDVGEEDDLNIESLENKVSVAEKVKLDSIMDREQRCLLLEQQLANLQAEVQRLSSTESNVQFRTPSTDTDLDPHWTSSLQQVS
jgi:hypothetical protein